MPTGSAKQRQDQENRLSRPTASAARELKQPQAFIPDRGDELRAGPLEARANAQLANILALQQTAGNCAVQQLVSRTVDEHYLQRASPIGWLRTKLGESKRKHAIRKAKKRWPLRVAELYRHIVKTHGKNGPFDPEVLARYGLPPDAFTNPDNLPEEV